MNETIGGPLPVNQKDEFRKRFRRHRRALDRAYRHTASLELVQRLTDWEIVREAGFVMTYLSFGDEVATFGLVRRLFAAGKSVAVPYIHQGTTNLIAARISDLEHDLRTGPLGILEPSPEHLQPIDPKEIDVHVVPGIAFDEMGFRIGYGKGYYDRFLLLRSRHAITVGAAFDVQVTERVPQDIWDIPVDFIATESQLINCSIERAQYNGQLGLFQHPRHV